MTGTPGVPPAPDGLTGADFPVHWPVSTRWADNDMFGHLNNAVYYQLFDTAITRWIAAAAGVDLATMPELVVVAESGCRYLAELGFPDELSVGLAVTRLGRSSVTYRLGVVRTDPQQPGQAGPVAAIGHWVEVYIDRISRRPVPIPQRIRELLETVCIAGA